MQYELITGRHDPDPGAPEATSRPAAVHIRAGHETRLSEGEHECIRSRLLDWQRKVPTTFDEGGLFVWTLPSGRTVVLQLLMLSVPSVCALNPTESREWN